MPGPRPLPHAARGVAAVACWLPLVLLGAALAAVPWVAAQLRVLDYRAWPPPIVATTLVVYSLVAVGTRTWRSRWPVHAALVVLLLIAHTTTLVQPLGDISTWREWARTDDAGASELLANVLYRLVFRVAGAPGLDFVAPACGAWLGLVFLRFVERHFVATAPRRASTVRVLGAAALALGGWQLVCFRGYVENTLPSLPPLLLGLGALMDHTRTGRTRALVAAAAWLALAALAHGVMTAMWPVLLLALVWHRARHGAPDAQRAANGAPTGAVDTIGAGTNASIATTRTRPARDGAPISAARGAALAAGVVVGTVGAVAGALAAAGFRLRAGHVAGGGDGRHFVPFDAATGGFHYEFAMLDLAHFADVGNLFAFTSPFALTALGLLVSRRWRAAAFAAVARQPVPAFAAAGATSFTSIYYFDLRFPSDLDLMVAMSAPLAVFLLQVAARAPRRLRPWLWTSALANGAATWALIAALLAPLPTPAAPDDLLRANRRPGDVALRRGEALFLGLQLPADGTAPFTFSVFAHRGRPQPLDDAARARQGGLAFAPPGTPGAEPGRVLVVLDPHVVGAAGYLAPTLHEAWLSAPLPHADALGEVALQALVRDARGRTTATNVVVLRPQ